MTSNSANAATSQRQQSAEKSTGLALTGAVCSTLANFGAAILVAKAGTAFAGVFFVATAFISILGSSSCLGAMTGLVYFMPNALDKNGEPQNVKPLLKVALSPVITLSMVLGVAVFIFARPIAEIFGSESINQLGAILRMSAIAIPAWAISLVLFGATRALGTLTPQVTINQIFKPLAQIILLAILFFTSSNPDPALVGLAWALPIVASAILAVFATINLGGLTQSDRTKNNRAEFWKYTRPRSISVALQILLERLDVIIVSALSSDSLAGVYGAITRFITAGNYLITSVAQANSPSLRKSISNNENRKTKLLLNKVTGWMVLLTWPYFIVVAVKSEAVIALMDSQFLPGKNSLTILAIGMTVSAFAGPIDATLLMLGKSRLSLLSTTIALILDVSLAWLLIPKYGIAGAAVAWVVAIVSFNLVSSFFVYKHSKLIATSKSSWLGATGALLFVTPIAMLTPQNFLGLLITGAIAGAALLAWIYLWAKDLNLEMIRKVRLSSGQ